MNNFERTSSIGSSVRDFREPLSVLLPRSLSLSLIVSSLPCRRSRRNLGRDFREPRPERGGVEAARVRHRDAPFQIVRLQAGHVVVERRRQLLVDAVLAPYHREVDEHDDEAPHDDVDLVRRPRRRRRDERVDRLPALRARPREAHRPLLPLRHRNAWRRRRRTALHITQATRRLKAATTETVIINVIKK